METLTTTTTHHRVRTLTAIVYQCPDNFYTRYGYTPIGILGKGMVGSVVLAEPPKLNSNPKPEALKTFSRKTQDGGYYSCKNRKYFLQEVGILQRVKHKYIMSNIEAFECPDEYIICMPYYKEGSLKQHLSSMTEDLLHKYMLQLTSAVLYLHTHHLAHRDIKPDNVLISDDRNVILSDFGIACVVTSKSMSLTKGCGTKGYTAPELEVTRPQNIDLYKCDMYSLGVVFWNMLFKRDRSYIGRHYLTTLRQQIYLPACYKEVVEGLLHQDPGVRWDSYRLTFTLSTWSSIEEVFEKFMITSYKEP